MRASTIADLARSGLASADSKLPYGPWLGRELDYQRAWAAAHPGYNTAASKRFRAAQPEKMRVSRDKWRRDNPQLSKLSRNLHRINHLLKKQGLPGISSHDVVAAWQLGTQACAICARPLVLAQGVANPATAQIDHCHTTGRFRGFLCRRCNQQLGHYEIWPEFGTHAAVYLGRDNAP